MCRCGRAPRSQCARKGQGMTTLVWCVFRTPCAECHMKGKGPHACVDVGVSRVKPRLPRKILTSMRLWLCCGGRNACFQKRQESASGPEMLSCPISPILASASSFPLFVQRQALNEETRTYAVRAETGTRPAELSARTRSAALQGLPVVLDMNADASEPHAVRLLAEAGTCECAYDVRSSGAPVDIEHIRARTITRERCIVVPHRRGLRSCRSRQPRAAAVATHDTAERREKASASRCARISSAGRQLGHRSRRSACS
jgi:hypothetical protein